MMLLLSVLLALPETAAAQQGSAVATARQEAARRRNEETRQVISRFGRCVARRQPAEASAFVLGLDMPNARKQAFADEMRESHCLANAAWNEVLGANFPAGTLRYTLAEALVVMEFSARPVPTFSNVPQLSPRVVNPADYQPRPGQRLSKRERERLEHARKVATVATFMAGYGECIVRTDPIGSHQLLMTDVTSAEESVTFGRLKPSLAACMPSQQRTAINKASIRGAVAINYYCLAKASTLRGRAGEVR
jgi:hypothetical protein